MSVSPGFTLWTSYRDMQDNSASTRRVAFRNIPYVHFTATHQPSTITTAGRTYQYNRYDPTGAGAWEPGTAGVGISLQSASEKGGFPGIDVNADSRAWLFGHTEIPIDGSPETRSYYDTPDVFGWVWVQDPIPDALAELVTVGTSTDMIWPKGELQLLPGNVTVFHLVAYQGADILADATIAYFRRQTDTWGSTGTWTAFVVDTTFNSISADIAASQSSSKVAIAWTQATAQNVAQGKNQVDCDVMYRVSTDAGLTWGPRINITNYVPNENGFRAYAEVSALYSSDDRLHIVWPGREWPADAYTTSIPNMRCRLFHWTESFPSTITTVTAAQWDQTTCLAGDWQMNIAKASISECSGRLYAFWNQFGNVDETETVLDDCASGASSGTQANGDIWMSVASDLNGLTWDRRRNLTNSYTPDCVAPDCDADGWPSVARYEYDESDLGGALTFPPEAKALNAQFGYGGDEYLHLTFVNDKYAGSMGGGTPGGVYTMNPFKWLMVPCVEPVAVPGCCAGTTGNLQGSADPSDGVDIADLQVGIDYLFFGLALGDCAEENDLAQPFDAAFDIADLQIMIDYLFFGAALPSCP